MDNIQKYISYLDQLDMILVEHQIDTLNVKRFKDDVLARNAAEHELLRQIRDFANDVVGDLNRQKNALKDSNQASSQSAFEQQKALLELEHANQRLKNSIESFNIDNVVRKIINRLNAELHENAARLSGFYNDKAGLQSELGTICTQVVNASIGDQLSLIGLTVENAALNDLNASNQKQIDGSAKQVFNDQSDINKSIITKIVTEILNFLETILPQKLKSVLTSYRKDQFRVELERTSFPKFNSDVRDKIKVSVTAWFDDLSTNQQRAFEQKIVQKQQEIDDIQSNELNNQGLRQNKLDLLNAAYKQILQLTETTLY